MLAFELCFRGENTGVLVTQLEISLNSPGRMLGTLSIITVRKRENQASTLMPLSFTGSNELIDDTLGIVGEISKLGLPDDQGIRRGK